MTIAINGKFLEDDAISFYHDGGMNFQMVSAKIAPAEKFVIDAWCFDFNEIFKTIMIAKALRQRSFCSVVSVRYQYLAGLRQDKEEGFCVPNFAHEILRFIEEFSGDGDYKFLVPHSCAGHSFKASYTDILNARKQYQNVLLVFPDKSAVKRFRAGSFQELMEDIEEDFLVFDKERDENGWIYINTSHIPEDAVFGQEVLLVDDICDGGITFTLAADALRGMGASKVHLHVHHGLFNNGNEGVLKALAKGLDSVSCHYYRRNIETGEDVPEGIKVKLLRNGSILQYGDANV